jgi:hypothetical protein
MWTDANHRRSIKFSPELRWNGEKTGGTLTSKPCKNKRVGGKSWCRRQRVMIRQSCGLLDLRIESTWATLAPSSGRPSRAPGRFAWIWTADSWRLSRNSFIHQSSGTDGRTDGQPARYNAGGGIYSLPTNKKISLFFSFQFCDVAQVVVVHKYILPILAIFKIWNYKILNTLSYCRQF